MMTTQETLEARLATLEGELTALKACRRADRTRRRWGALGLLVLGLLGFGAARGPAQTETSTLTCKRLEVVGADGKVRVVLGTDEDGGTLRVGGNDGNTRVSLLCDTNEGPGLVSVTNANGKRLVNVTADVDGGLIQVNAKDASKRVTVACGADEEPGLVNTFDAEGRARTSLSYDKEGGKLFISGKNGKARATVSCGPDSGPGLLGTYDTDGQIQTQLGYNDYGGKLFIDGSDGTARANVYVSRTGAGIVNTYNRQGKSLVSLNYEADSGDGGVWIYDSDGQQKNTLH